MGLDGTITINTPDNNFLQALEISKLEIVALPDFFTPRCQNPHRARLTLGTGEYLPVNPNYYFSSPTSSVDWPPELEKKLERLQRELESNSEPNPKKKSHVLWQPGEQIVNATEVITTESGRVFLIPPQDRPRGTLACGQNQ